MEDYRILTNCLLCGGNIDTIFSLGDTPLANEFLDHKEKQDLFPLNLTKCSCCGHVQLDCIVNLDRMFKQYLYVSGTSPVNVKHFEVYANSVIKDLKLTKQDFVIDIGSNDGTFLKPFQKHKINVLGVDPAENIAKLANKNGIPTKCVFFNKESALKIHSEFGKAKVITCNNMFAHNDDLDSIVFGVKQLLNENGTFIFENTYLLDMYEKCIFDIIYHEHIHQHSITPLSMFFKKHGMKIYRVDRLPNHGGSIRVFVCQDDRQIEDSVFELLKLEEDIDSKLKFFIDKFLKIKSELCCRLNALKDNKKTIAIYGVPAKATTLMYAFNLDASLVDFAVDDAILKQGLFTPGKQIPIYPPEDLYIKNPDYILVLGWNFAESIMANHHEFKGGWIIPLPQITEH